MPETWPGTCSLPLRKRDAGRRGERRKCEFAFGPASMKLPSGERGRTRRVKKQERMRQTLEFSI